MTPAEAAKSTQAKDMNNATRPTELAAVPGSPPAGSHWHIMRLKNKAQVHCKIRVCSFTPLVTGDNAGGWYVKYYAQGNKHEVECRCSIHEWRRLVNDGRIVKANDLIQPPDGRK